MESGWLPGLFPIKIWWKLDTDGSSLRILGKAGAVVLIRREDGDWVVGFSAYSGTGFLEEQNAWRMFVVRAEAGEQASARASLDTF
ncbi:hypothetical protein NC652_029724 [Populus alba x Populus x berolinensis]|nr:hypothetical protein NC652_029724 [Populus alba x Populus x berolinensis]